MELRCRTRIPVGYPANIQNNTGTGKGVLLDLSPSGCRMRSDIDLNAGAYPALLIAVAQEPAPLAVEVSVVRWSKDGYRGVEFLRYSQGVGIESQIFSPPRHSQMTSSILTTPHR